MDPNKEAKDDKDPILELTENADGTVSVGTEPAKTAQEADDAADGQPVDDQADDALAADGGAAEDQADDTPDPDPDREAIRQRRREEKKARRENQRQMLAEREAEIVELRQRLAQTEERVGGVMAAQHREYQERLEATIGEVVGREAELKAILASDAATAEQRAEATSQLIDVAQRKVQLANLQARVKQQATARPKRQAAVDPRLKTHADAWLRKNTWFKVDGNDTDSMVAKGIDAALMAEGKDPTQAGYWEEFDRRVHKYLPHRKTGYTPPRNGGNQDGDTRRPKGPAGGGSEGGGSQGKGGVTLSAARVQAIKDAGMWDDPAARSKAVQRYINFDRANARRT